MTAVASSANEALTEAPDFLCFDLGRERFAFPMSSIEAVIDGCNIEPTWTNGATLGVLRAQGEILPVYDAAHVLRCTRTNAEPLALVLRSSTLFVAVLVDAAEAASRVSLDGLRTPHALISSDRVLEGVLRVGERWVGLLNSKAFVDALTGNTEVAALLEAKTHDQ